MDNLNPIQTQTKFFCEALKKEIEPNVKNEVKKIQIKAAVKWALRCLVSESTANGSSPNRVRALIIDSLPENSLEPNIKKAYIDYHTEFSKIKIFSRTNLINLKSNSIEFLNFSIGGFEGFHYFTGMVRKVDDCYSLTIANAGYGSGRHGEKNEKTCTVMTSKFFSEEKLLLFLKFFRKSSLFGCILSRTISKACDLFYDHTIELIFPEFNPQKSFTNRLQLAGSCSGRSELLILKHFMKRTDYRQLKINLSEKFILQSALQLKTKSLSTTEKIITLDAIRRLYKRYEIREENRNKEIFSILEAFEKKINIQLDAKEKLKPLKKIPIAAEEVFKNCLSGMYHLEAYAFKEARTKIKESIRHLKEDPPDEFSKHDIETIKIFTTHLENMLKNKKNLISLDQRDLFSGLLIIAFRLKPVLKAVLNAKKHKNFFKNLKRFIYNNVKRASIVDENWREDVQKILGSVTN